MRPAVVWIHGGALISGNRRSAPRNTELAKLYARKGDWAAVLSSAEVALRRTPAAKEPRMLRVAGLLRIGQQEQAARELETLIRLSPKEAEVLRGWFAKQR